MRISSFLSAVLIQILCHKVTLSLRNLILRGALRSAHRYGRFVNPHKIPFFLLGGLYCDRYEALGWRERMIFQLLQKRWDTKRKREALDLANTNNIS
jgi:hypothetical protein